MTDIKLSVALFSHPVRSQKLQRTLQLLGDSVPIEVILDKQSEGIWPTAMRAWRAYAPDATHHLVLQDDIIPCRDFLQSIPSIIRHLSKDASVSFCDNVPAMHYALKTNRLWVYSQQVRHAQALLQPVTQIEPFILWSEWNVRPSYYHDDGRLEMYLHSIGKKMWHTAPSLVSHDDDGSVYRRITKGEGKPDYKEVYAEHAFIGHDVDPLSLDWSLDKGFVGSLSTEELRLAEKWAIGELEIEAPKLQRSLKHMNSRIWNDESLGETYEETMQRTRRERGLI